MKKIVLVILASVIGGGGVAAGGTYYFMNKEKAASITEKQETITKLENELKELKGDTEEVSESESDKSSETPITPNTPSTSSTKSSTASTESNGADATAGWQTYINRDIGYIVKYPQGWTLEETNRWDDNNRHIRYITINNQDNSIHPLTLHWGFVRNGTFLYSTDRTGIGAGEITEISSTMPILGASIKKTKLTFEGKIKEYFYTHKTPNADYTWEASIATRDDVNNTATNNLADYSEVDMAEAILANIELML